MMAKIDEEQAKQYGKAERILGQLGDARYEHPLQANSEEQEEGRPAAASTQTWRFVPIGSEG